MSWWSCWLINHPTTSAAPASLTWGALTLTKAVSLGSSQTSHQLVSAIYYGVGPLTAGTNNITGTYPGATANFFISAYTLSGVNTGVAPSVGAIDNQALPENVSVSGVLPGSLAAYCFGGAAAGLTVTVTGTGGAANALTASDTPNAMTTAQGSIAGLSAGTDAFLATAATNSRVPFVVAVFQPLSGVWTGGTSSDWGTNFNWNPAVVPNASGVVAIFGSGGANPAANLTSGSETAGALQFNAAVSTTLSATSPNILTLDNTPNSALIATTGTHVISAPISLNSNLIISGGNLTLSGQINGNPGQNLTLASGTVQMSGLELYSGQTTIGSGATLGQAGTAPAGLSLAGPLLASGAAKFNFRVVGSSSDSIVASGAITLATTNVFNFSGTPTAGVAIPLMTGTSAPSALPGIGSNTTGMSVVLSISGSTLSATFKAPIVWGNAAAANTNMNTASNWVGGVLPGPNDVIQFNSATIVAQPALSAALSVQGVLFTAPVAGGWTLSGANTLTVGGSGVSAANTSGTNTFTCTGLVLGAAQTWLVGPGTGILKVNSTVTSASGVNLTAGNAANTGTITFSTVGNGATFVGGITINGGIVSSNFNNAGNTSLGSGPIVVNSGGFLRSDGGDSFGYAAGLNPVSLTVNQGGTVTTTAANFRTTIEFPVTLIGGTIMDGGNAGDGNGVFSINAGITVVGTTTPSVISTKLGLQSNNTFNIGNGTPGGLPDLDMSTGSLVNYGGGGNAWTKSGPGTMKLGGTSTFINGTTLNAGTLQLGSNTALNTVDGALTFSAFTSAVLQLNGFNATLPNLIVNANPGTPTIQNGGAANSTLNLATATALTFPGTISDGSGGGTLGLNASGAGSLTLTGTDTFSGATTISDTLNAGGTLACPLTIATGGTLNTSINTTPGTLTLSNTGAPLTTTGTSVLNFRLSGLADGGTPANVGVGSDTINASAGPVTLSTNSVINIKAIGSSGTYTLISGTSVNGIPNLTPNPGLSTALSINPYNGGQALQLTVAPVGGTFVWSGGAGAGNTSWQLAANWLGNVAPSGNASENLIFPPLPTNSVANNLFPSGTTFLSISVNGGGYTLSGNQVTLTGGASAFNLATASGNTNLSLILDGAGAGVSLAPTGGTVTLSGANTYTGPTTIGAGVVTISTITNGSAVSSPLGSSSNAASNLVLNGGTLQYTGTTPGSTDRLITLGANGGGIDGSGSTAANILTFTNPGPVVYGAPTGSARTLTFTGSCTGANLFAPVLTDAGGSGGSGGFVSVAKSAASLWYFQSTTNSYSGTTTLSGGTFGVHSANSLSPNSTVVFAGTATLDDSNFAQTIPGLTLNDVNGMTATLANAPTANPLTVSLISFISALNGNVTTLTGGNINIPSTGLTLDSSGYGETNNVNQGANKTLASTLIGNGPLTLKVFGDIADTGGGGGQRFVLSGTNTFTGTITVTQGFVFPTTDAAFGNANNPIILSATAAGGGGLLFPTNPGTISATRSLTLSGTGDRYIRCYGGVTTTINCPITGTANLHLTDGATLVFTNTGNTYTGATILGNSRVLTAGAANSLPAFSQIQFPAAASRVEQRELRGRGGLPVGHRRHDGRGWRQHRHRHADHRRGQRDRQLQRAAHRHHRRAQ